MIRHRILLLLVGLALGLSLSELAVRWFVPVRNVGPAFVVHDPIYYRRLKSDCSFVSRSPEFSFRFSTNRRGLRDPDRPWPMSGSVLCLGDSFTMGYAVSDEEPFPRQLERELERRGLAIPVVNAGLGGAGTGYWVKFLEREAPELEPGAVVLQVCSNDFGDNQREGLYVLSEEGLPVELPVAPKNWKHRAQGFVDAIPGVPHLHLPALLRQVFLGRRIFRTREQERPRAPTELQESDNLTFALIQRTLTICRDREWHVVMLNVGVQGARLDRLEEITSEAGASLVSAPLKETRPDLYYEVDGHWVASGHAFVATMLQQHLVSSGFLPAKKS